MALGSLVLARGVVAECSVVRFPLFELVVLWTAVLSRFGLRRSNMAGVVVSLNASRRGGGGDVKVEQWRGSTELCGGLVFEQSC